MISKKKLLEKCRLYVILDKKVCRHRSLVDITKAIKGHGLNIIQFRDKEPKKGESLRNACRLRKLLLNTPNIFMINDYLDLAKIIDSDGVHLGQYDSSLQIARKILGKDKLIGVSCHNLSQAQKAQANGADYISIGPLFATPTKPQAKAIGLNLLKEIAEHIKIPFFAIGGINENNIARVLSYGAKRVAVCRAVCQAKNISSTIKHFQRILDNDTIRIR